MTGTISLNPRRRVWKLLGATVLLQPVLAPGKTRSGLYTTNVYDKPAILFRIIGIGPGAMLPKRPGSKKKVWVAPDMLPGQLVLSDHWTRGGEGKFPAPCHIAREDGKGLVLVDCRYIIAKVEMDTDDSITCY